jgi:outer membrane receptor protein involved in Fe transport
VRYIGSYKIDVSQVLGAGNGTDLLQAQGNGGRVKSQNYHDLFVTYRVHGSAAAPAFLAGTEWQLGVRNVFNTTPPLDVSNAFGGYYSGFGDPRLASYYLSVKKSF